jgi:uncharacterized glyoxalase superfamily protein PhnB
MAEESFPAIAPVIIYRDPNAALAWLEEAFGFETYMVIANKDGLAVHSEMKFERANFMVAISYAATVKSPLDTNGLNTQALYVYVKSDVDAHCERARASGAKILQAPTDLPYGERVYKCADPEGHEWTFSQVKKKMSHAEMAQATGMSVRDRL